MGFGEGLQGRRMQLYGENKERCAGGLGHCDVLLGDKKNKMLGHLLCTGDGVLLGETSWPVLTRSVCYFCLLPECREED